VQSVRHNLPGMSPIKQTYMEYAMRIIIPATAIGLVLAAATSAQAQTVVTSANPSMQTIQTTETTRTVRPARSAHREVVTTRTVTRQVVPNTTTVIARTVPAQPLYDEVTPAVVPSSNTDYGPPLYDTVAPVTAAMVPAASTTQPFIYRYVYEPDRILVIDPTTNIAVQSIPR
jgi:hypothetical protein